MHRFRSFSFLVFIILSASCGNNLPELKGVDQSEWIADIHACKNKRAQMIDALYLEKDKLLALSEMDIVAILGKPDENELYKRNQKFYYYYLEPSKPHCEQAQDSLVMKLIIRFNAMGLAKEVSIE